MAEFIPIKKRPPFILADWEPEFPDAPTMYEQPMCPVCGVAGQTCIGESNGLEVEEDVEELARLEERRRTREFFAAADRGEL